jgi:transcription elongation factor SPT6
LKQFLSDKEPGEKVIRASSRGPSFFTLTLKIADGIYAHKEISEDGKDHKDIMLPLGKTLTVNNETFEDLDEVGAPDIYTPLSSHFFCPLQFSPFISLG